MSILLLMLLHLLQFFSYFFFFYQCGREGEVIDNIQNRASLACFLESDHYFSCWCHFICILPKLW